MKKGYLVQSYGGDYEDSWTKPLVVFLNKSKAESYVKSNEIIKKSTLKISPDLYEDLCNYYYSNYKGEIKNINLIISQEDSKYSLEDLKKTDEFIYRKDWHYYGMLIDEIDIDDEENTPLN